MNRSDIDVNRSVAHRPSRLLPLIRHYALAVLSVGVALGVSLLLQHFHFRDPAAPLLLFAVAISSWYGGPGPAALAVILSIVSFYWYFVEPVRTLYICPSQIPYFIIFAAFAALISWFATLRRRAEAALREQANLLNLTHDAIFTTDMEGVTEYWNRGAEERYGWTADQAVGRDVHDLLKTRFPAPLEQIKAEVTRTGRWEGELVHTKKDGTQVVVATRWSLQRDKRGAPVAILETNNDITERKRAEEALRDSEEDYRNLIELASDAIFITDANFRLLDFNASACALSGYSRDEILGKSILDFVLEEDLAATPIRMGELLTGKPVLSERRFRRKDGVIVSIEVSNKRLPDGRFQGIVRDITERKEAEQILRATEEKFRKAFNSCPDPMGIRTFPEGRLLEINDAFVRASGYSREEAIGKTVSRELGIWARTEDWDRTNALIARDGRVRDLQVDLRSKAGEPVYALLSAERIDLEGQPCVLFVARDITERKRAEEALRQSEAYLAEAQRLSHAGSWALDVATDKYVYCSEECLRICGFDPQGGLPTKEAVLRRVHPGDVDRVIREIEKSLRERVDSSGELRIVLPDGTVKDIHAIRHPVLNSAGDVVKLVGTSIDITERKRAEEALRESEERFRSLVENATVGIYRTTPDGRILMANPALVKMLGCDSFEELARRNLEEEGFEPNYPRSEFKALIEREGEIAGLEEAWIRRDGTTIFLRESARAKRGPNGDVQYYDGIVEDFTERRRAEESRRYLASIVESSDDAIFGTSCEGVIQSWNRGAERLYSYTAAEMIGQPVSLLASQDQWGEIASLRDLITRGDDVQHHETVRVRKDGSQVDVSTTLSTIKDTCGRVIGASIIAHDITKQKRAQQELERSLEQLRALAARLQNVREEERKLLAREIHDQLGQALTAIKIDLFTWVSQIGGDLQNPPQGASALLRLLDQTLKRVRQIATELRPGILDDLGLVAAIEWAGQDFEARTGIKCRLDLPQEKIVISPERATAIFRILQESLTNVVRHAAASEVKILLGEKDKELILLVQDNGKGMRMDKLSRTKSLGILGMHERALVFGGEVIIRAAPGKGTTVRVRIPQACLT